LFLFWIISFLDRKPSITWPSSWPLASRIVCAPYPTREPALVVGRKETEMAKRDGSSATGMSGTTGGRREAGWTRGRLERALSGEGAPLAALIEELTPVIRCRIRQALQRSGATARCGEARFEVEDLTQDVLMRLFREDGAQLRRWDPARGLSLRNFAGLIAQRYAVTVLRRQHLHRESALPPEQLCEHEAEAQRLAEQLEASQHLGLILTVLRDRVSAKAMRTLELLHVEGYSVPEVCEELGMTPNALYASCTRVRKQLYLIAVELKLCDADGLFGDRSARKSKAVAIAA
jgi:RNA polymerase sigma factor (sigma-70 family)